MSKKRFVYYQPNEKDIKDKYGDCTIRALTKACNMTWLEAFDKMIPYCRQEQVSNIFNCSLDVRKRILADWGFEYKGISNKRGSKRPTVDEFAKDHPTGTYICNVANHEVTVVDGKYYDTWDSGVCSMYGYFEKVKEDCAMEDERRLVLIKKFEKNWRAKHADDMTDGHDAEYEAALSEYLEAYEIDECYRSIVNQFQGGK